LLLQKHHDIIVVLLNSNRFSRPWCSSPSGDAHNPYFITSSKKQRKQKDKTMANHGNWKDLFKAAREGDIIVAKHHLQQGIDANFQHPEYLSAPLHEAIHHNQLEMVRLLIEDGKADPQLKEDMTDDTPLEMALAEERHAIVDYLNTVLPPDAQFHSRRVLVTGGNRGIGRAIVERLLRQGHVVAFTCRNDAVGQDVADEILEATGCDKSKLQVIVGDLSTVASIYALAQKIRNEFPTMQVMMHNAGLWPTAWKGSVTKDDGLEEAFIVNYMAPYILNQELLPLLEQNSSHTLHSRVVLVTAGLFIFGKADIDQTPYGKDYSRFKTYMHTKQCGMIWCMHQARKRLENATSGNGNNNKVTFTAVHPGVINTGLGNSDGCLGCLLRTIKTTWKSPEQGAEAPVWLAVSDEATNLNGVFYNEMELHEIPKHENGACVWDPSIQDQWYQWTEDWLARYKIQEKPVAGALSYAPS